MRSCEEPRNKKKKNSISGLPRRLLSLGGFRRTFSYDTDNKSKNLYNCPIV